MVSVVGFVATMQVMSHSQFPRALEIRVLHIPEFTVPGHSYFYTDAWNFELSQPVLYHNLGDSIQHAKNADIIYIGNSRLQLGIREEFIVPLAEQEELKVFSIGADHSEVVAFAFDVIRKHDLRPKVFVTFGGSHVYHGGYSKVTEATKKMSRWEAMKLWSETWAS